MGTRADARAPTEITASLSFHGARPAQSSSLDFESFSSPCLLNLIFCNVRHARTHADSYGNTTTHAAGAVFQLNIEDGAVVSILPSVQPSGRGVDKYTVRARAAGGCRARVQIQHKDARALLYLFIDLLDFGGTGDTYR